MFIIPGYSKSSMEQEVLFRCVLLILTCSLVTGFAAAYMSGPVKDLKMADPAKYEQYESLMTKGDAAMMQEGNFTLAYSYFKQAKQIVPKDSTVLASIGRVYRAAGDNSEASYYFSEAETQAQLDNKYGDMGNSDYYDFMSKLSDERVRMAHNQLSRCTDEPCRINVQRKIDQYERERADWNVKKAEEEAGIGLPSPLFAVFGGLVGGAVLLSRRRPS